MQLAAGLVYGQTALGEQRDSSFVSERRQVHQQGIEPRAHFLRGLAGKSEREYLGWLGTGQQGTQHARDQQPGLAAARAGLDHATARGVERGGNIEGGGAHGLLCPVPCSLPCAAACA